VRGTLCRTTKGKFTKCKGKVSKGSGSGFSKKHTKGTKGRCVKWSSAAGGKKRRCLKRANPGSGYGKAAKRGRCLKWSKGRTRCMQRAK